MDLLERPVLVASSVAVEESAAGYAAAIAEIVERQRITSHFQPILDLHHGTVMAWEVLSRGPEPFSAPTELFAAAEEKGIGPQLEYVCRHVALRTIAGFPAPLRSRSFFINVSPNAIGTVTIRQLIMRSTALEVQSAQGSSPLTGLPGNRSIERWILNALDQPNGCVLYADLDRFKEYNDCYGFLKGDEMIRCVARVLSRALAGLGAEARLGHIGGDDFVIVVPEAVDPAAVRAICTQFDAAKVELFESEDVKQGSFRAVDRRGQEVSVPLVTLSVAVVPVEAVQSAEHPGALVQMAASLKRKVKEMTASSRASGFLFERRGVRPAAERSAGERSATARSDVPRV